MPDTRRGGAGSRWRTVVARRCSPRPRSTATSRGGTTSTGRTRRRRPSPTTFTWNHTYGPLNWPRDGRELLRVQAAPPGLLEGREPRQRSTATRWLRGDVFDAVPSCRTTRSACAAGRSGSGVTVRNLRSRRVHHRRLRVQCRAAARRPRRPRSTGSTSPSRTLRRGDTYTATVYAPRPTADASAAAPAATRLRVRALPDDRRCRSAGCPARGPLPVTFPPYGASTRQLGAGPPVQSEAQLQQLIRSGARSPAPTGCRSSSPRAPARPRTTSSACSPTSPSPSSPTPSRRRAARARSTASCSTRKTGYCQQYSGAMALLLRMAGIPARVSTGFSTGRVDTKTRRVRGARLRRPLVGRGLLPRLGLDHVRPDARRVARRAASPSKASHPSGGPSAARAPTPAATAAARARTASPPPPRTAPVVALRRCSSSRLLAAGLRRLRRRAPAAPRRRCRRCSSSSGRCAAPGASPRPGRRCTRSSAASPPPRPPRATCAR